MTLLRPSAAATTSRPRWEAERCAPAASKRAFDPEIDVDADDDDDDEERIAAALAAARKLRRIADDVVAVVTVSPRGGAERICRPKQRERERRERD